MKLCYYQRKVTTLLIRNGDCSGYCEAIIEGEVNITVRDVLLTQTRTQIGKPCDVVPSFDRSNIGDGTT